MNKSFGMGRAFIVLAIETGDPGGAIDQLLVAAPYGLLEHDCGTGELLELRSNDNFIMQNRRLEKVHIDVDHHELQPALGAQPDLIHTQGAEPLGAAALHEFQVIRVIHHPTPVGVLPVDGDGEFGMRSRKSPASGAGSRKSGKFKSRSPEGAFRPKCR